jgi:uncharacterized membrane protein YadS
MILPFILIIIAIAVVYTWAEISDPTNDTSVIDTMVRTVVICILIILLALVITENTKKETTINNLNGNWEYKQGFVYSEGDTIPSDTLYIKIE